MYFTPTVYQHEQQVEYLSRREQFLIKYHAHRPQGSHHESCLRHRLRIELWTQLLGFPATGVDISFFQGTQQTVLSFSHSLFWYKSSPFSVWPGRHSSACLFGMCICVCTRAVYAEYRSEDNLQE